MHIVYADANCDKADNTDNASGNFKGNSNNVVSTLITKDLKSPFVIVTLRMLQRITMEMQVLLVNLGAITKRFSIFKF
jgi:hypothetical protein